MRQIKIIIELQPEGVYCASSDDMPGFNVECEDKDEVFDLSRELALDFLRLDNEIGPEEQVSFDFEVRGEA